MVPTVVASELRASNRALGHIMLPLEDQSDQCGRVEEIHLTPPDWVGCSVSRITPFSRLPSAFPSSSRHPYRIRRSRICRARKRDRLTAPTGQAEYRLSGQVVRSPLLLNAFARDRSIPLSQSAAELRDRLVATLHASHALSSDAIAHAFRTVPRERFVPGSALEEVYRDQAIVTKNEDGVPVSSSSQPAMMALMLQQLEVRPGLNVLEIGAGTGYNAALLSELVGPSGSVSTIEIDPEVVTWARERLTGAGYDGVRVIEGDGSDGWPAGAPYDRIELTVGAADIAPPWVEQLKPGGILVLPLWINTVQICLALVKEDGRLRSVSSLPCGFTRIRGRLAGRDQYRELFPGVILSTGAGAPSDDVVRRTLSQPPRRGEFTTAGSWFGFMLWLALKGGSMLSVSTDNDASLGFAGFAGGVIDAAGDSACLLTLTLAGDGPATILSYGSDAAQAQVTRLFNDWQAAGSPDIQQIGVTAVPSTTPVGAVGGFAWAETENWRLTFREAALTPDPSPNSGRGE
jgi:protein-L-isoaspartate(D-aspartate) O-methyltransferase